MRLAHRTITIPEIKRGVAAPLICLVFCSQTDYKQLTVRAQFGEEYPHTPLLIELTSKTVPEKLLEGMVKVCDQEMQKHKGKRQVCAQMCQQGVRVECQSHNEKVFQWFLEILFSQTPKYNSRKKNCCSL